jgi:hypothetical protein
MKEYRNDGEYRKSQYQDGSMVANSHNGWIKGNSVLVHTLSTGIEIMNTDTIAGSNGNVKTTYNVSAGERTANFQVTPQISIASEANYNNLVSNGTQATRITITITLPKKLSFQEGSLSYDYSGSGYSKEQMNWTEKLEENADGTSTITLKTYVSDIEKVLPVIRYSCTIGDVNSEYNDVTDKESLITTTSILAEYEEKNILAAQKHSDTVSIIIQRDTSNSISKEVDERIHEIGEEFVYTLNYNNLTETQENIQLIDVLPYNGDKRQTCFNGQYRVARIELQFTDSTSYTNFKNNGSVLKYQSGQSTASDRGQMLTSISASGTQIPKVEESDATYSLIYVPAAGTMIQDADDASGIALYADFPNLQGKQSVTIRITLTPLSEEQDDSGKKLLTSTESDMTQQGGDVYGNNCFYKSNSVSVPVSSSTVIMQTINRAISGKVFLDMDQDGQYSTGSSDQLLKGIDVTLYSVNDEGNLNPATDVMGNPVETVETDASGWKLCG